MTSWIEYTRVGLLALVLSALLVRLPAAREVSQRPVLVVLVPLAVGALSIQVLNGPLAVDLDRLVGIERFNDLAVSLIAIVDFACVWWLAIVLYSAEHSLLQLIRAAPAAAAALMATITVWSFTVTPVSERFTNRAHGYWMNYAIAWAVYALLSTISAVILFARVTKEIRHKSLRLSVGAIALGTSAEIPYAAIHAFISFDSSGTPQLTLVGFWCSFTRFCLVTLGCVVAAVLPLLQAIQRWHRRQCLHSLWVTLQVVTPSLRIRPSRSRTRQFLTFGHTWEELHRQIIDMQDSLARLQTEWWLTGLEHRAAEYVSKHPHSEGICRRTLVIACSLAASRQGCVHDQTGAKNGTPPTAHGLRPDLTYRDYRELSRLLKSPIVAEFAREVLHPGRSGSKI